MANVGWDRDRAAARAAGTPPHVLTNIAMRRPDLRADIAANPGATPELIRWMNGVSGPGKPQPQPQPTHTPTRPGYGPRPTHPGLAAAPYSPGQGAYPPRAGLAAAPYAPGPSPYPPRRKGKAGYWFAGCGCLVVVAFMGLFAFAGLGAILGLSDAATTPSPSVEAAPVDTGAADLADHIALYEQERTKIDELSTALEANPVKPLVALFDWMEDQDAKMTDPNLTAYSAELLADQMSTFRADLEQSITDAQTRRTNASASVSEGLIDAAGNGFIDVQYDAATACGTHENADQGYQTVGCVKGGSPLIVHLLPDAERTEWHAKMTTVHELAHVYQRADDVRYPDDDGGYQALLAQGLFQGSEEVMADCYALTYLNEWTLSDGVKETGYGYVCGDSERQAIRDWAAGMNAPVG
ncbi:hypothetical protein [Pseudoclavibacter sp. RFBB5]|uniref:variant leucine-rich repeat-containing protein n=1 Tax=Pseudoclavibacter sp. RFBB5 TaxID=2080574 RepID=UPI000CE88108|nr:hypothetical protein [Pseudoclavibacter sp. RFBB5]PPG29415.1 hypothetical protein C5B97_10480 [Pseudoclavibacter sp. RFBB5]